MRKFTTYHEIQRGSRPLVVESTNDPRMVLPLISEVIRVTGQAYAAQHESGESQIPRGTFEAHYDPYDPDLTTYVAKRALIHVLGGGVYHFVRNPQNDDQLDATAHTIVDDMGDCDVKEIMAHPAREGLGSAMLHAALLPCLTDPDCFNGEGSVKLEAIHGSSVNRWYESIGFVQSGAPKGAMTVGAHPLPIVDYAVPESIGVRGVMHNLEQRHPELRYAEVAAEE